MKGFKETKLTLPKIHQKDHVPRYKERKTPEIFDDCLHSIWCLVGGIGRGKSYTIVKMCLIFDKYHTFDKIFWVSPTISRDDKRADLPDNVEYVEEYTDEWLINTKNWALNEIDEYIKYEHYYKVYQKVVVEGKEPTMSELMLLQIHEFEKPFTPYKYGFPSFFMVVDDLVAEKKIFSPNCKGPFSKFLTSIRHASFSVCLSSQILRSSIPASLRGGNIAYWLLYKTSSQKLRKTISEELSDNCKNIELFDKVWTKCTENPHDFLFVNYHVKDKKLMFRRCFDNQIELTDIDKDDDDVVENDNK